jgi:tRNA pseudouridine55 synthase
MAPRRRCDYSAAAMLHGLLIVDKPARYSSAQVVDQVRRRAAVAKAGHTGTLDPLATGVLPICLGRATKLAGYLIAEDKTYDAELELGVETDSLDREGVITAERLAEAERVSDEQLAAALAAMVGAQQQLPPMFSAIKQGGVRLYHRARAGEVVEREPRAVVIHRLELRWRRGRRVAISVHCSKGTFVRSLAADLGAALGCGAHVVELRRTRSGAHALEQAVRLDELTPERAAAALIPMPSMLRLPSYVAPRERQAELRDGRAGVLAELAGDLVGMGQVLGERGELIALIAGPAAPGAGGLRYLRVFPEGMELPMAGPPSDAGAASRVGDGALSEAARAAPAEPPDPLPPDAAP